MLSDARMGQYFYQIVACRLFGAKHFIDWNALGREANFFRPSIRHYIAYIHYNDVTMDAIASQITSLTIVYSTVYSDADQRKHQSSALLAFVRGIHRGSVNSPHKWPVTRKMSPFDDVIMVPVDESRCPCSVQYKSLTSVVNTRRRRNPSFILSSEHMAHPLVTEHRTDI